MNILIPIAVLFFILLTLKWISDQLEEASAAVSYHFHIPASVAGATLLAIASSAPEFFTSLSSAVFQGIFYIGLITIIWSAIFNILVITGFVGILSKKPKPLAKKGITRDFICYSLLVLSLFYIVSDSVMTRVEAGVLILFYILYVLVLIKDKKTNNSDDQTEKAYASLWKIIGSFTLGIGAIGVLCYYMIEYGLDLALAIGMPITLVSAIIFAAGTSVPDLLVSMASTKRGNSSSAVANIFGSNTFDIAICLGVPILIVGDTPVNYVDSFASMIMLIISVFMTAIIIFRDWKISKIEGYICLLTFISFLGILIFKPF